MAPPSAVNAPRGVRSIAESRARIGTGWIVVFGSALDGQACLCVVYSHNAPDLLHFSRQAPPGTQLRSRRAGRIGLYAFIS